ncbi:MAG: hypothetical protein ABSH49_24100 [Bryobacteraceae bacterium]
MADHKQRWSAPQTSPHLLWHALAIPVTAMAGAGTGSLKSTSG